MRTIYYSTRICAMLICCVAEAQILKDTLSTIETIPIKIGTGIEDATPTADAIPVEPPIESTPSQTIGIDGDAGDDITLKPRGIIAGVDDNRKKIQQVCLIKVDPTPDHPNLSSPLECARTCRDREPPKICYYRFRVEYYSVLSRACEYCSPNETNAFCNNCECVPVDGVERPILTVNRMIPGPSIEVCEGDKIVVDVSNEMEGEELTIHWHGLFQKGSQHYDGATFVTQCPISAGNTFRYQFNADNEGTHFWHAHTGLQKMDGIFGTLIVRKPERRDVNRHLYNYDLSRHVIIINDWMHELSTSRLPGRLRLTKFQDPDSILINGKGYYQDPASGIASHTELEVFNVTRNNRYRFRLVNAFCTVCASILTVEGHNLTIIAADGIPVKPTVVNSIVSVSGERYDFVVSTNNRVGTYWIQLRTAASCKGRAIQQLAKLHYDRADIKPRSPVPTFIFPISEGIILNPLDGQCDDHRRTGDGVCLNDLHSSVPVDADIFTESPDARVYLPFTFYRYNMTDLFAPNNFHKFIVAGQFRHTISTVNGISLNFPSSPLLTQPEDVPPRTICNSTHKPADCNDEMCMCTHVIELPYNGIIELIIIDETGVGELYHPFHLHGYAFNVMGTGIPNNRTKVTVEQIKQLDEKGLLPRRTTSPPFKDTVAVPNNGYAIVRFRANNPGFWLFHCHFVFHLATGMGNIFHVGDPSGELPTVPRDFPKCGNFVPTITRD